MAARTFVLESMLYRTAGYWDLTAAQGTEDAEEDARLRAASEEYAIECAILKFFGTEVLAYVVDEALQIHGGFGYSEEFPIAQFYRDVRVFRIFEGTNEINRLTVPDQLQRRARQGRLPLFPALDALSPAAANVPAEPNDDPAAEVGAWGGQMRAAILYVLRVIREAQGDALMELQEVAAALADMAAALFALESAWLRACKLSEAASSSLWAAVQVYGVTACAQVEQGARTILTACLSDTALPTHLDALRRLLPPPVKECIALRHAIAEAVIAREGYPWP